MKVAFVWKWGSWKSTISGLFIQYLLQNNLPIIWIDGDININLLPNLWITLDKNKSISKKENEDNIRRFLMWNNKLIWDIKNFVKTTPPWKWSNLICFHKNNYVLESFSQKKWSWYFMYVWTYEKDSIGKSCYHNNLAILENIISHTYLKKNEFMVVDMVAWTDSFSNSLHSQFDVIFLVVEPTVESISVTKDFIWLSKSAWTLNVLKLIWNKIEWQEDLNFIAKNIDLPLFNYFNLSKKLKISRQLWELISLDIFSEDEISIFQKMYLLKDNINIDYTKKMNLLHKLHIVYCWQEYVKRRVWDISNQIDKSFNFKSSEDEIE